MANNSVLEVLKPEVQKFIRDHEHSDTGALLLKYREVSGVSISLIVDQIKGRGKAKEKLPIFYAKAGIVFPPAINLEQSSSQATAEFKADLLREIIYRKQESDGVDLTGGFGIDALFLSKLFRSYHFCEPKEALIKISQINHQAFSAENISYHNTTAEDFLKKQNGDYDLAYIDPSRRLSHNKKVFTLAECEPNITELQKDIFKKAKLLLVKASPLLDIQQGLKELSYVKKVVVLSVRNDCKELLFLCERDFNGEPAIEAVNLIGEKSEAFNFYLSQEKSSEVRFSHPLMFLYEPNASILKAGAFKSIAGKFGIHKIHPNTHLYTSDTLINLFPGRIFKMLGIVKTNGNSLTSFFPEGKANVTTRNYPMTPEELKKKFKLQDGGERFLFAFTGLERKYLVAAERIFKETE